MYIILSNFSCISGVHIIEIERGGEKKKKKLHRKLQLAARSYTKIVMFSYETQ